MADKHSNKGICLVCTVDKFYSGVKMNVSASIQLQMIPNPFLQMKINT